uniref:CMP/dCMP-type deaminase domain-containing protein n=2 Tax=Mucochytrium quahogii TaxID=96639 RepID=A0A7S2SFR4_9STRA
MLENAAGEAKWARGFFEMFSSSDSETGRLAEMSKIKNRVKKRQLCECEGTCEEYEHVVDMCLEIVFAPSSWKMKNSAVLLLTACFEKGHRNTMRKEVEEQFSERVQSLVREATDANIDDDSIYFSALTLRSLMACSVTRDCILDRLSPEQILCVMECIYLRLSGRLCEVCSSENSTGADIARESERLGTVTPFLMDYLLIPEVVAVLCVDDNTKVVMKRFVCDCLLRCILEMDKLPDGMARDVRTRFCVLCCLFNNFYLGYNHLADSPVSEDIVHTVANSVTHLFTDRNAAVGLLQQISPGVISKSLLCIFARVILSNFPSMSLFLKDPCIAEKSLKLFQSVSNTSLYDVNVQMVSLQGMDEWCKCIRLKLSSPSSATRTFLFWEDFAETETFGLFDFVLDNWSHGARKARYHLEPLFHSALSLIDYVCYELAGNGNGPCLTGLEAAKERVGEFRRLLAKKLLHNVVDYNRSNEKTNLKASLPALKEILKRNGASSVLDVEPKAIDALLQCFDSVLHLVPSAARLVVEIIVDLEKKGGDRQVWLKPIAFMLASDNDKLSSRLSEFLLPALIQAVPGFDTDSVLRVFEEGGHAVGLKEKLIIWGCFRNAGYEILFSNTQVADGKLCVPFKEMECALLSLDVSIQEPALSLVFVSKKKSSTPTPEHITLWKSFLAHCTKWGDNRARQSLYQVIRQHFEWLRNWLISNKAKKDIQTTGQIIEYFHWFQVTMLECVYPGAPLDRSSGGLERLLLFLESFCADTHFDTIQTILAKHKLVSLLDPLTNHAQSKDFTFTLLNMLGNSYDRSRELAYSVLAALPAPLAGIEDSKSLSKLFEWVRLLLSSSRVRDIEGGSTMLRVIHQKYILDLGWDVSYSGHREVYYTEHGAVSKEIGKLVDGALMNLACIEAEKCERSERAYCVGAVIVNREGDLISKGFSRELPGNTHAEESALMKLGSGSGDDVASGKAMGCTIYSTMEPCSVRLSGNRPCSSRCITAGVDRVVVGVREPSKFVVCTGTSELVEAGIVVDYIEDKTIARRCMEPNMFLFPDEEPSTLENQQGSDLLHARRASRCDLPRELVGLGFMWQLVEVFGKDVEGMSLEALVAGGHEYNSAFGIIRAIRYCWQDIRLFGQKWRALATKLLQLLLKAMSIASNIVGEPDEEVIQDFQVDCRGHLVVEGPVQGLEEIEDPDGDERHATTSPVVVNCFLLIRHGTELLDTLVKCTPLQVYEDDQNDNWVLSYTQVEELGTWVLSSLQRLKHMGAVWSSVESFQGIAETLLRIPRTRRKDKDALHLSSLPRKWVDFLLNRLEGGEQGFFLRRSAGFAGAFRALSRAEPKAHEATLLHRMMSRLLGLGESPTLSTRVHSLNILKMLVEDGSLHAPMTVYISSVLILSIRGFKSAVWQVRNSSMMIFSRVVKRAFGVNHQGEDNKMGKRMGANFFFERYPAVRDVLLQDLSQAVTGNVNMDPSLYPLLLLLSRLEPLFLIDSDASDLKFKLDDHAMKSWSEANADVITFLPLLVRSASQRHAMARIMAARALGSIIPNGYILPTLGQLLLEISVESGDNIHFNHIHGVLYHIYHLFSTCMRRDLFARAKENGQDLEPVVLDLENKMFAGFTHVLSKSGNCQIVQNVLWDALDIWLQLRRSQFEEIPLSKSLLEMIKANSSEITEGKERAIGLAATIFPDDFCNILEHKDVRLRLAVLEALSTQPDLANKAMLAKSIVTTCLREEERMFIYPPELKLRLELLERISDHVELDQSLLENFWDAMLYIYARAENEAIKTPIISVLSKVCNKYSGAPTKQWVQLLRDAVAPDNTYDLRMAACNALGSQLLDDIPLYDAWVAVFLLVQDEVDSIRHRALQIASRAVLGGEEMCESITFSVLFEHIHALFGRCSQWESFDNTELGAKDKMSNVLDRFSKSPLDLGLLSVQLFEQELDNVYDEPLLVSVMTAYSNQEQAPDDESRSLFETLSTIQSKTAWPGGVSFNPELFGHILVCLCKSRNDEAFKQAVSDSLQADTRPVHPHIRRLLNSPKPREFFQRYLDTQGSFR